MQRSLVTKIEGKQGVQISRWSNYTLVDIEPRYHHDESTIFVYFVRYNQKKDWRVYFEPEK